MGLITQTFEVPPSEKYSNRKVIESSFFWTAQDEPAALTGSLGVSWISVLPEAEAAQVQKSQSKQVMHSFATGGANLEM